MNNSAADRRSPLWRFLGPASEDCGKRGQQDYAHRGLKRRTPLQEFEGSPGNAGAYRQGPMVAVPCQAARQRFYPGLLK
jgi:hypothetical protein